RSSCSAPALKDCSAAVSRAAFLASRGAALELEYVPSKSAANPNAIARITIAAGFLMRCSIRNFRFGLLSRASYASRALDTTQRTLRAVNIPALCQLDAQPCN